MTRHEATATAQPRVFETFDEALRVQHLPFENYAIMHRIVGHIPMSRFEESGGFVRGIRVDGRHDLLFKSGYTTGFTSKEEGETASGVECHSNRKTGVNWMVWHPLNRGREGGSVMSTRRECVELKCPTCGNVMPATGICDFCA